MCTKHHSVVYLIAFFILNGYVVTGQTTASWVTEYSDQNYQFNPVGMDLIVDDSYIVCDAADTNCITSFYTVLHFTPAGVYSSSTSFGNTVCQNVLPRSILCFGQSVYVACDDSSQALQQHGNVNIYDNALNFTGDARTEQTAEAMHLADSTLLVISSDSIVTLTAFDPLGNERWSLADSLLFGDPLGFHNVQQGSHIYLFAGAKTDISQTNKRLVVSVLDTSGNLVDTVEIDPFINLNEQILSAEVRQNKVIYGANYNNTGKVGANDLSGAQVWQNTFTEFIRGVFTDTASGNIFVFTQPGVTSVIWNLYMINLQTGQVWDTLQIDSVYGGTYAVSFLHAESVGVYFAHRNSISGNAYSVERFNVWGLNDWNGAFNSTIGNNYSIVDMKISATGSLYLTGKCLTDVALLVKFDQLPPLSTGEISSDDNSCIRVYPIPANSVVNVTFDTECKSYQFYSIVDLSGRIVRKGDLSADQNEISVNDLLAGFYVLSIFDYDGNSISREISIIH